MSIQTQQRMAARLSIAIAFLVALSLLLVGWTLYRPGTAAADPAPVAADNL